MKVTLTEDRLVNLIQECIRQIIKEQMESTTDEGWVYFDDTNEIKKLVNALATGGYIQRGQEKRIFNELCNAFDDVQIDGYFQGDNLVDMDMNNVIYSVKSIRSMSPQAKQYIINYIKNWAKSTDRWEKFGNYGA